MVDTVLQLKTNMFTLYIIYDMWSADKPNAYGTRAGMCA